MFAQRGDSPRCRFYPFPDIVLSVRNLQIFCPREHAVRGASVDKVEIRSILHPRKRLGGFATLVAAKNVCGSFAE